MEKKQNSVEFLWQELKPWLPVMYKEDDAVKIISILKQAVSMHKEEIEKAQSKAISKADMTNNRGYFDTEQYYKETFE